MTKLVIWNTGKCSVVVDLGCSKHGRAVQPQGSKHSKFMHGWEQHEMTFFGASGGRASARRPNQRGVHTTSNAGIALVCVGGRR